MELIDRFARHTDEPGRLTRLYLSPAHRRAVEELMAWMRQAGMSARLDAAGNVVGRYEGETPHAPALLIGSHIDTVRDAGRYDGALGVLAGLVCVEALARDGRRLPVALEVIAFGDEEGVRFPSTLTGSRALVGSLDPAVLDGRDHLGTSLREALVAFGCDPGRIGAVARRPGEVLAYLELHIEQGPVLEASGVPVGVVTAINGATRLAVEIDGLAGHAGTVPMALRADALAAAAEMILAVEAQARSHPDLVATVGQIEARPGAVNIIPGRARFTVDIRSPADDLRERALAHLLREFEAVAGRRGVTVSVEKGHQAPASVCDPRLAAVLEQAVARTGVAPLRLPSGAGHDAMVFAGFCPVGMLFVRCAAGISHNPAETVTLADADAAMRTLMEFVTSFDPSILRS